MGEEVDVAAAQPLSLAARSSRSRASAAYSAAIAESSFRQQMSIVRSRARSFFTSSVSRKSRAAMRVASTTKSVQ